MAGAIQDQCGEAGDILGAMATTDTTGAGLAIGRMGGKTAVGNITGTMIGKMMAGNVAAEETEGKMKTGKDRMDTMIGMMTTGNKPPFFTHPFFTKEITITRSEISYIIASFAHVNLILLLLLMMRLLLFDLFYFFFPPP